MSKPSKIPYDLIPVMTAMVHEGKSSDQIQAWLVEEHGVNVASRTVAYHTSKVRRIELAARKQAIQDAAAKTALDCVEMIDKNIVILNREAQKLLVSPKLTDKNAGRQLAETALKYMDKKLNLTGMDSDTETEHETAIMLEGLMKKLSE